VARLATWLLLGGSIGAGAPSVLHAIPARPAASDTVAIESLIGPPSSRFT
jgi:hypothetical protein